MQEAPMIGRSEIFLLAIERAKRAAGFKVSVLIRGETGTGKDLVARLIHHCSKRKGPFVAVNCANLQGPLMESQLFGHEQHAFTGAVKASKGQWRAAEGGTLFLDEIGELSFECQARLLRALESGQITPVGGLQEISTNVRIISATNQPLEQWVEEGRFRRDLYARLSEYELILPPLRERGDDIILLAEQWLETSAVCRSVKIVLTLEARVAMLNHPWPENIRGLQRWLTRLAIEGVTEVLPEHLPGGMADSTPPQEPKTAASSRARKGASRVPEAEEVLEALQKLGKASRSELEIALHLAPRSLQYILPKLRSQGLIHHEGSTHNLVYFPNV